MPYRYPCASKPSSPHKYAVIPAQAGIRMEISSSRDSRLRGNDGIPPGDDAMLLGDDAMLLGDDAVLPRDDIMLLGDDVILPRR